MFQTDEDVRSALAKRLRREPDPAIWRHLVRERYVGEVLSDWADPEEAFETIVSKYKELERLAHEVAGRKRTSHERLERIIPTDLRLQAQAEIVALEAGEHPEVQAWRARWLPNGLVAADEVAAWIIARSQEEPPAPYVRIPLFRRPEKWDDLRSAVIEAAQGDTRRWGIEYETLECAGPDTGAGATVLIASEGALAQLKSVCRTLTRLYDWREPAAVRFVLTGEAPPPPPRARVTVTHRWAQSIIASTPRITIKVNPRVAPRELAALYQQVREKLFPTRDRPIGAKRATMAGFLYRTGDLTWEERLARWNQERPEWHYTHRWHFSRDALAAFEQVTGTRWQDLEQAK